MALSLFPLENGPRQLPTLLLVHASDDVLALLEGRDPFALAANSADKEHMSDAVHFVEYELPVLVLPFWHGVAAMAEPVALGEVVLNHVANLLAR